MSLTLKELRKYAKVMPAEFRKRSDYCPSCQRRLRVLGSGHFGASRVESWLCEDCKVLYQVYTDKQCYGKDPYEHCNMCGCAFW